MSTSFGRRYDRETHDRMRELQQRLPYGHRVTRIVDGGRREVLLHLREPMRPYLYDDRFERRVERPARAWRRSRTR
jgi:hypothetical protein